MITQELMTAIAQEREIEASQFARQNEARRARAGGRRRWRPGLLFGFPRARASAACGVEDRAKAVSLQ